MSQETSLPSAKVAVITRTKDRGIMLRRAAWSVANQCFKDYVWVIVNDGGSPDVVEEVVDHIRSDISNVVVVHHPVNLGMEAASNSAISAVESEFIVIHDDDDSWHPDFLSETVSFLESERGRPFGGVVTGTMQIDEQIVGDAVRITSSKRWRPLLSYEPRGAVQLADLAVINQFPPIAFLYRRQSALQMPSYEDDFKAFWNGTVASARPQFRQAFYNPDLPVLGDWEFNLRFVGRHDIAVIERPLANYHLRPTITAVNASLGNSVHAGYDRHATYEALIRNRFLRKSMFDPSLFMGKALYEGRLSLVTRMKSNNISRIGDFVVSRLRRLLGRSD